MPSKPPSPDLFVETQPTPLPAPAPVALDLDLGLADLGATVPPDVSAEGGTPVTAPDFASTSPDALAELGAWIHQKALVVHDDPAERIHWRARMALANLVWMDEAVSTAQALAALGANRYSLVVVSCECVAVDPVAVVEAYHSSNERGLTVVTGVSRDELPPTEGDLPPVVPTGWAAKLRAMWKGEDLQSRFHHSTAFSAGHYAHQLLAPLSPADMDAVLREWKRRLKS